MSNFHNDHQDRDRRPSRCDRSDTGDRAYARAGDATGRDAEPDDDAGAAPPQRYDGRIRKGEVRNRWGRKGSPMTRLGKQVVLETPDAIAEREFRRRIVIKENGSEKAISYLEAFVRSTFADALKMPIKLRMELLFGKNNFFRRCMEQAAFEDANRGWNDLLEEEFQVIAERVDLDEIAKEARSQRVQYNEYLRWCALESARIGPEEFERMDQTARYRAYLADSNAALAREQAKGDLDADDHRRDRHGRDDDDPDLGRFS